MNDKFISGVNYCSKCQHEIPVKEPNYRTPDGIGSVILSFVGAFIIASVIGAGFAMLVETCFF